MKVIYLDNAATTAVDPEVLKAMKPYFLKKYGNPSEPHILGQEAKVAVEDAREKVASFLRANSSEVIFTSCATESINLAHKGLVSALKLQGIKNPASPAGGPHIITTQIEHKAVLESCKTLEGQNLAKVTYLPVDKFGLVKVEDIKRAILEDTVLVSVMYANNEVGAIQPVAQIGKMLKQLKRKIYFHTDATQALQYLDCNVNHLGVDLLSFTGHKFHAPKGVGALYIKSGTPLLRREDGGNQEFRMRAGTENVPYIVGLGKAIEINSKFSPRLRQVEAGKIQNSKLIKKIQEKLVTEITKVTGVKLTGHPTKRVPHIASFTVEGAEGEALVLMLSNYGIMASSGSACTSSDLSPSHVLTAMGIPAEISHGALRFSLSKYTTQKDLNYVIKVFPKIVETLRKMAPKNG